MTVYVLEATLIAILWRTHRIAQRTRGTMTPDGPAPPRPNTPPYVFCAWWPDLDCGDATEWRWASPRGWVPICRRHRATILDEDQPER